MKAPRISSMSGTNRRADRQSRTMLWTILNRYALTAAGVRLKLVHLFDETEQYYLAGVFDFGAGSHHAF